MADQTIQNQSPSSSPQGSSPVLSDQNSNLQPQSTLQAPLSNSPQQDILNNPAQKIVTVQDGGAAKPAAAVAKSQAGLTVLILVAVFLLAAVAWRVLRRYNNSKPQPTLPEELPIEPVVTAAEPVAATKEKPLPAKQPSTSKTPASKKKKKKYNARKHR